MSVPEIEKMRDDRTKFKAMFVVFHIKGVIRVSVTGFPME